MISNDEQGSPAAAAPAKQDSPSRADRFAGPASLLIAVLLHIVLAVAVVQAWMAGWPGKIWLTLAVVIAFAASAALFRKSKNGPLIIGCAAISAILLWAAVKYGPDAAGLKVAGLPFETATAALIVLALIVGAAQLWTLASSPRMPRWLRIVPAVLALYAIAMIVLGTVRGTPASQVVAGEGPLPWWMSGGYIGSAILLPIALIVSLVLMGMAAARRRSRLVPAIAMFVLAFCAFSLSGLALTRNNRPNLAQFIVPASLAGGYSSSLPATSDAATSAVVQLGPGEEDLAPFEGKDIDDIFARVATGVRYEPYIGILRGPIGTAVARSGNSFDQSMLLAEVLRRAGYKVRYARGNLAENNVDALIRGMYPPGIAVEQLGAEYAPYDPAADAPLRALVRDHMWVEVFQGDSWLPLDPSFPRAVVGSVYADGARELDAPSDDLFQRVEATLREETANGQTHELGQFSGTVAELAMKPISLVVRTIPQSTGGDTPQQSTGSPAGQVGGMGDALGGGTSAPPPPEPPKKTEKQIVGVAYVRDLSVAGASQTLKRTTVRNGDTGAALKREWIEFKVTAPGSGTTEVQRVLYEANDRQKNPAVERRYTIHVLSGRIPRSFADRQTALASGLVNVKDFENKGAKLAKYSPDDPASRDAAVELGRMGDALGSVAGHLLALRFASESDSLSRRIADGTGVALAWPTPRIFIVGIEMSGEKKGQVDTKVSLDLRLDEVRAYPYPNAPSRIAQVFQAARGIQESVIEGKLVALATGRQATANTAQLVNAAQQKKVPMVLINTSTRSQLGELVPGVPPTCVQMMDAALAKGREIIIPSQAVAVGGEQRWGWWEVDPESGEVIGVMQDGQHQGMAEYTVNSEEIGLNDESGQILGMMMGSITTVGTLSALILEYGTVTPALIKELEAFVGQILCNSCMESAGVKAEVGGGFSAEVGNECYKPSKSFGGKVEVGGELKVGFCEAYGKGFKCSAGLILSALKKEALISSKTEISFKAESEAKIGCTDVGGG